MPLKEGSDYETIYANYRKLREEGYSEDQAWAISYNHARKGKNKKNAKT